MDELALWKQQLHTALTDYQEQAHLQEGDLFVVGCSTSEVIGERIGTAGTMAVAETIYSELKQFQEETGVMLAFQGCEHINRALTIERTAAERRGFEMVSVIPVRSAGGALSTFAYHHMNDPVVVEFIKADGGIDIGDTFIGMHLKHVPVPVRTSIKEIGQAHVTMAKTRPKLIGGARAVYATDNESVMSTK